MTGCSNPYNRPWLPHMGCSDTDPECRRAELERLRRLHRASAAKLRELTESVTHAAEFLESLDPDDIDLGDHVLTAAQNLRDAATVSRSGSQP